MKIKKRFYGFLIIFIGIVCFIGGWWAKSIQCHEEILDLAFKVDSLDWLDYLREDEQLPYFGMKKEDVLPLLPEPEKIESGIILCNNDTLQKLFWIYNPYKKKLKGTSDTIVVDGYYWKIPYNDKPDLYIVFEKKGEEWIVSSCAQWDDSRILID